MRFQACVEADSAKLMLMMMDSTHIVIMSGFVLCEVDKQVIDVWTKKKREDGGAVEVGREENSRSSHVLSSSSYVPCSTVCTACILRADTG